MLLNKYNKSSSNSGNLRKNLFDYKSSSISNKKGQREDNKQHQTNIATYRLNRPRCQFSEKHCTNPNHVTVYNIIKSLFHVK